jgi:dihydrofolate reductase
MRPIIYHVASSLDGFITGKNADVSRFLFEGDHVDDYNQELLSYDTVIMGKNTYEFGYAFGLVAGQPAYANMQHYIFSKSIEFENKAESVHIVNENWLGNLQELKAENGSPIYLCGGGEFAGFLFENGLIDQVKLKLNPIILGDGVPLFGNSKRQASLELLDSKCYKSGVQLLTYTC